VEGAAGQRSISRGGVNPSGQQKKTSWGERKNYLLQRVDEQPRAHQNKKKLRSKRENLSHKGGKESLLLRGILQRSRIIDGERPNFKGNLGGNQGVRSPGSKWKNSARNRTDLYETEPEAASGKRCKPHALLQRKKTPLPSVPGKSSCSRSVKLDRIINTRVQERGSWKGEA